MFHDLLIAGSNGQKGAVLIFVLWMMAVLTVIAGYYSLESRMFREASSGPWIALKERAETDSILRLISALADEAENSQDLPAISATGEIYRVRFGQQEINFSLEDEHGKLDLNRATEDELDRVIEGVLPEEYGDRAKIIVDSILDWRDNDGDRRFHGAEDTYYMGMTPPYHVADRKFLILDELLLVRGVDLSIFYGPLHFSSEEKGRGEQNAPLWAGGLQDLFTIYNHTGSLLENAAPVPLKALLDQGDFSMEEVRPDVLRLRVQGVRGITQVFFRMKKGVPGGYVVLHGKLLPRIYGQEMLERKNDS